ncbi:MAG TPA: MFS transporter [Ktedonobacteraceae bacterium]|nr:MFS transporter [Ktedonobacteraceae bacterium]
MSLAQVTPNEKINGVGQTEAISRSVPLWRNRDYVLLWGGQMISALGSRVSLLAFPLFVLALTHSPAQAGLIGAMRGLPFALLILPAGALVDRWNRKRVMISCDIGRALALGSIPLALILGRLTIAQIYVVSLVEGTLFTFFSLAHIACLPHVVSKEQLPSAVAQESIIDSVTELIGPSFGGVLYSIGRAVPFLTDAISYGASVVSLLFIQAKFQEERDPAPLQVWADIKEGLSWLWQQPLIRFLALLTGGMMAPVVGYSLILIVIAQSQHASAFTIGVIFACGGVGSIVGAFLVTPLQKRLSFGQIMIASTWIWALTWLLFAVAPNPLILGVATAVSFIIVPIFLPVQFGYRLALIPDHLQGRVNSVFRLIAFGSEPIGLAVTGILLQAFGPITTVLILFVPQFILSIAATLNKDLRIAKSIEELI